MKFTSMAWLVLLGILAKLVSFGKAIPNWMCKRGNSIDRWLGLHYKAVFAIFGAILLGLTSGYSGMYVYKYITAPRPPSYPVIPDEWTGQWHGELIGADWAYDAGYRGQGVKIAIIDTGIDYYHDAFEGIPERGISFTDGPENDYYDEYGHGSFVGSLIVSKERRFMGVAPEATIINIKMMNDYGWGLWGWAIKAVDYAIEQDVDIITMSFGGDAKSAESYGFYDAIKRAEAAGILMIAAAGNSGLYSIYQAPATWDEVVAVTAIWWDLSKPEWAAVGNHVDLAAPGLRIYGGVTGYLSDYLWFLTGYRLTHALVSGTSMSAPLVAAAAAVIMSSPIISFMDWNGNGKWDAPEVRAWMEKTAYDVGPAGWDREYGHGIIDLGNALQMGLKAPQQYDPYYLSKGINIFSFWETNTTYLQLKFSETEPIFNETEDWI